MNFFIELSIKQAATSSRVIHANFEAKRSFVTALSEGITTNGCSDVVLPQAFGYGRDTMIVPYRQLNVKLNVK